MEPGSQSWNKLPEAACNAVQSRAGGQQSEPLPAATDAEYESIVGAARERIDADPV
jgi:hypothetical protein